MNYSVSITLQSRNVKTGPIPVSTTTAATCPAACPFNNGQGCYAAAGPLALHWRAVTAGDKGTTWREFCGQVAALPDGQLWRHNQAGDLPGNGARIDARALRALVKANRGRRGFTYTHYDATVGNNAALIREANQAGFTVNLSGNNLEHADALADLAAGPVVVVLPADASENTTTPAGRRVVVCPATQRDNVSCATCQLCARGGDGARVIVGFPAHGAAKRKAEHAVKFFRKG